MVKDGWKQESGLVSEECPRLYHTHANMSEHEESFVNADPRHEYAKACQDISCWVLSQDKWLALPLKPFLGSTNFTGLVYRGHGSILFYGNRGVVCLAVEAK